MRPYSLLVRQAAKAVSDESPLDTAVKQTTAPAPPVAFKRGADIETALDVALERVARGGEESLRLNRPTTCPSCRGSGGHGGAARRRCEACQGTGHLTHGQRDAEQHRLLQQITPCPSCYGHGSLIDHPCAACRGTGTIAREETLTVTIPRGIADHTVLRIAGKGLPSPDTAGCAGDLLVLVQTQRDQRFERDGANLLHRETIALTDAVLGTTRAVPTLDGTISRVHIPPGTQPETVLHLPDLGLPVFDSDHYGELQVRIQVQIPEHLSHEERALYERLRVLASRPAIDDNDGEANAIDHGLPSG